MKFEPSFESPALDDPPHRILVVDDNQSIHEDFRKILSRDTESDTLDQQEAALFGTTRPERAQDDFEIDFALQGSEALEKVTAAKAAGRRYAVVFMDVRMPPGWDGIETTSRLWEIDPDLQVVICTAYSDYSWSGMIERLGRTDQLLILKKPFDLIEVVQCAHALCGKWSLLQETRRQTERLESTVRARTAELSLSRDAALGAMRLKSQFLANMSHEIRTPMNGILGMADLLTYTKLDEDQRDYINTISSSADSLLGIINDILDSSKIESGTMSFENIDFDLRQVIRGVLEITQVVASKKPVKLTAVIGPEVGISLQGDPGRLRQVLTNIVGNAVKFTARGDITLSVHESSRKEGRVELRFEVRDTGIGIPKDARGNIFEPFIQGDGTITRKYGGTGLGLAICRQIVHALGGEIGVESEVGEGSTFWFTMDFGEQPQSASDEQEDRPTGKSPGDAARQRQALPASPARPLRILVAEDNPVNLKVILSQLQRLGYTADVAADGVEALQAFEKSSYDVIFMDCQMPNMDGYTATREIRRLYRQPVRIIAVTANTMDGDREKCLAAGMDDYLPKPVSTEDLRLRLEKCGRVL